MEYEQLELDVTLEHVKDLKTNLSKVIKFTYDKMTAEAEESGWPLKRVDSIQEAYGIASQCFVKVVMKNKMLKGQMEDFLKLLEADDNATQISGTIYNAALELAMESIIMAAHATRILNDLYYRMPKTPIEDYLEDQNGEDGEDSEDGDGFSDAEDQNPEQAEDLKEDNE